MTAEKDSLNAEIEKYQGYMLHINAESFNQGVRRVAFFHGVSGDNLRYDLGKDVVNGQLVSLGGDEADDADQVMENPVAETAQSDETIEIL